MTHLEQQTLYVLFCLSRDTRHISASTLAAALSGGIAPARRGGALSPSVTPTCAAAALVALERAGLVDASRARLTMLGLAQAVRLGSAAGGPRLDLRAAVLATRPPARPLPLAAAPASVRGDGAVASPLA